MAFNNNPKKTKNKTREMLIEKYLKALEENEIPWKKGWMVYDVINPITNVKYRGNNRLLLQTICDERGYGDPRFLTFNQIADKGWKLNDAKGQGVPIEFFTYYDYKEHKNLTPYEARIKMEDLDYNQYITVVYKTTYVFNATLIEGIPPYEESKNHKLEDDILKKDFTDNLIEKMGVDVINKESNRAFYSPSNDQVVMPLKERFFSMISYYATLLHELAHATGHSSRLNRPFTGLFGRSEYAKEELRAEIASSFVHSELSMEVGQEELNNHKAYIQSWISVLKKDPNELFRAIRDAEKIADYMIEKGELEKYIELQNEREEKIKGMFDDQLENFCEFNQLDNHEWIDEIEAVEEIHERLSCYDPDIDQVNYSQHIECIINDVIQERYENTKEKDISM